MRICSGIDALIAEVSKELELLALVGKSLLKELNENKKAIKESKADLWTEKNIRNAKEAKRVLKDTVDEKRNLKKCYVEIKKEIKEAIKATNTKTRK